MRRRILLLVVGMTVLVILAFAIPIAILTRNAVGQSAEQATRDQARSLVDYLRFAPLKTVALTTEVDKVVGETGRPTSITLPSGAVVGSTPADSSAVPGSGNQPAGGQPGGPGQAPGDNGPDAPHDAELQPAPGGEVAVAVAQTRSGVCLVRVFLSDSARYSGTHGWYALLVGGSVGLLLIAAAAGEVLTRRIARPLVRTAQTAQQLSLGDTLARAPTDGPREVADVGTALNRLADRIDELISEERETVADLSHRLRTPLTTLRLEAEALRDPDEAEHIGARVGELERMLTAVIRAARRPQREGRLPSSDATAVVAERVTFWSALAEDQGRTSTVELPAQPLIVRAGPDDLAAAVDALLENVVAHTPEGTPFAVRLTATGDGARLEISDEGLGIPDDAIERGRSDRGSTGLGLDIARRSAEAAGGTMSLERGEGGGARVVLTFRAP